MTRVMRDSTSSADIPTAGTDLVAGYTNGHYAWKTTDWAKFKVPHVTIDVSGSNPLADVLDVEPGDATVQGAVRWVRAKLATKPAYPPILYVSRAQITPLFNALKAAGYHVGTHFRLWIATLDGTKTVKDMTGVTAVQWASAKITGHHYDESIVYDDNWKKATPAPTAHVTFTDAQKKYIRDTIAKHNASLIKELGI